MDRVSLSSDSDDSGFVYVGAAFCVAGIYIFILMKTSHSKTGAVMVGQLVATAA